MKPSRRSRFDGTLAPRRSGSGPQRLSLLGVFGAALAFFATACTAPVPDPPGVVELRQLASKSEVDVAGVLGKPADCEATAEGRKCDYSGGVVEVVFIDGKADWITVHAPSWRYAPASLRALGLTERQPSFSNENVTRWTRLPGFREISMFPGQGGMVSFFYCKVLTD